MLSVTIFGVRPAGLVLEIQVDGKKLKVQDVQFVSVLSGYLP
jgi:hypothetical protein